MQQLHSVLMRYDVRRAWRAVIGRLCKPLPSPFLLEIPVDNVVRDRPQNILTLRLLFAPLLVTQQWVTVLSDSRRGTDKAAGLWYTSHSLKQRSHLFVRWRKFRGSFARAAGFRNVAVTLLASCANAKPTQKKKGYAWKLRAKRFSRSIVISFQSHCGA